MDEEGCMSSIMFVAARRKGVLAPPLLAFHKEYGKEDDEQRRRVIDTKAAEYVEDESKDVIGYAGAKNVARTAALAMCACILHEETMNLTLKALLDRLPEGAKYQFKEEDKPPENEDDDDEWWYDSDGFVGSSVLHYALSHGAAYEIVHKILDLAPSAARYVDGVKSTPLHAATDAQNWYGRRRSPVIIRRLLKIFPEAASSCGYGNLLPLHLVVGKDVWPEYARAAVIPILRAYPGALKVKTPGGYTPRKFAALNPIESAWADEGPGGGAQYGMPGFRIDDNETITETMCRVAETLFDKRAEVKLAFLLCARKYKPLVRAGSDALRLICASLDAALVDDVLAHPEVIKEFERGVKGHRSKGNKVGRSMPISLDRRVHYLDEKDDKADRKKYDGEDNYDLDQEEEEEDEDEEEQEEEEEDDDDDDDEEEEEEEEGRGGGGGIWQWISGIFSR